jgi:hypothetical protein
LDENYRPDVRGRRPEVRQCPRLPRGRGFTHGRVLPSAEAVKIRPRGRWGASVQTPHIRAGARIPIPPLPPPLRT